MTNDEAAEVDYLFEQLRALVEDTDHVYSPVVLRDTSRRIAALLERLAQSETGTENS